MPEHAALITVLILDRPMCLDCIADKTTRLVTDVRAYLERIGTLVTVKREPAQRCRACGNVGYAVSISRSES